MSLIIQTLTDKRLTRSLHQKIVTSDYASEIARPNSFPCSNSTGILDTSWLQGVYGLDIFKKSQSLGEISTDTKIDCSLGEFVSFTLTGNIELTLNSNLTISESISPVREVRLVITSLDTAYTITWKNTIKWVNSSAPIIEANKTTVVELFTLDNGNNWYGKVYGKF